MNQSPVAKKEERRQESLLLDTAAIGFWLGYLEAQGKINYSEVTGFFEAQQEVVKLAREFQNHSRYDDDRCWNGMIGDYYEAIDAFAISKLGEIFGGSSIPDDTVLTIRWKRDDLEEALSDRSLQPFPEYVEVLSKHLRALHDVSVSNGWEILSDTILTLQTEGELPEKSA